jgi:tetratricopeptide (TPR) repeat protein
MTTSEKEMREQGAGEPADPRGASEETPKAAKGSSNHAKAHPAGRGDKPARGGARQREGRPQQRRTAVRPKTQVHDTSPLSADFFWHSVLLFLGRVGNRVIEFYNSLFMLQSRDMTRIYENLGRGFRKKGLHEKALAAYRELINLNPANADAHFQMGRIYDAKGESELALVAYQSALEVKPNQPEALYRIGMLQARGGDLDKASDTLNALLTLNPSDHRALYRLGILCDKRGEPEQALEHLAKAVEIKDDDPKYHQYLGFVYEGLGRHQEAVRHFKSVMEMEGALDDRF